MSSPNFLVPQVSPSSSAWTDAACAAPDDILLDHAHCEKKAAATSLNFLFKYTEEPHIVSAMSRIAREELLHFERVVGVLHARGVPLRRLSPSPYGGELFKLARTQQPEKLVDDMLVCALIEARSCERFALLAERLPDPALRALYEELGPSEERHAALYVDLACRSLPEEKVAARLAQLTQEESRIVSAPGATLRLHAG